MSTFNVPIIGKCDNCGAELRGGPSSLLKHPCPVCGGSWREIVQPPDPHTDLRAALNAAVEAGVIEGWRNGDSYGGEIEWLVSMTAKQASAPFLSLLNDPHA